MGRERRSFHRISGIKNPSLIVIATEGEKTEQQYFSAVGVKCEAISSRLKIEVIPPDEHERVPGDSAPKHVLAQLSGYKKKYGLNAHDDLCMVIDRDAQSWTEAELSFVAAECTKKQFLLALSNPCFELWLLVHLININEYSDDEKSQLLENKRKAGRKNYLKAEVKRLVPEFNPSNLDIEHFWEHTNLAIERAEALDIAPLDRWPNSLGSRVYLLMKKIIAAMNDGNE